MSNTERRRETTTKQGGGTRGRGGSRRPNGNGRAGAKKTGRGNRWFSVAEIALWVLVAGAVAYRFLPARPSPTPDRVTQGGVAPDFTVNTLNAGKISLSHLRGDVVLVNFWATWCPPCRLEIPGIQRVYDAYKDKGFTVVGLSTDQTGPGVVSSFLRKNGVTYPVGMATDEMRIRYGGVDALPESFLVDKTGHVRKMVEGMFNESILRQDVGQLLAEGAK